MSHHETRIIVLVAEDDTLVRLHGIEILVDAGFEALEARNADEALVILDENDAIQLLFSDIDMPGSMNGLELARLVHRRWPNIRLLLTSGNHQLPETALPESGKFLSKPWTQATLVEKITKMLAT